MKPSRQQPKRRGMALIWVALAGIVFIVFLALAADTARVYMARHQLQNAADAAALAGVYKVRNGLDPKTGQYFAYEAAHLTANATGNHIGGAADVGGANLTLAPFAGNDPNGDVVIGLYDSNTDTFTPTLTSPNAVQVTARRTDSSPDGPLPLLFAKLAGINSSNVSRTATAVIGGPSIQAGLVLLNRHDPNVLDLRGTGSNPAKITVNGGGVQVNSDDPNGTSWSGQPLIDATGLFIGSNPAGAASLIPNGVISPNAPPVPDPLAGLPAPAQPTPPTAPNPDSSGKLKPGYYGKNSWPKNKDVKLNSGIYWIDGGIDTSNNIDATAGVMLYLNTGSIVLRGNATLTINPITTAPYTGISIFQARGNTSPATIRGSDTVASTGVFYFPNAQVTMWGTPQSACTQLIADSLDLRGTGTLTITYDGSNPILGHAIWLVR